MSDEKINKQLLNDLDFEFELEQRLVKVFNENQASGFNKLLVEAGPINWGKLPTPELDKLRVEEKNKAFILQGISQNRQDESFCSYALNGDLSVPYEDGKIYEPQLPEQTVQANLFGEEEVVPEPVYISPALSGQDIINIRALTGKKKDNAVAALNQLTVEMLAAASPDYFYIPINVASSKNSKEIGFYWKKNEKTGKNEKVPILVDSDLTKSYKKNTAGYWLQNKVAFLNQTRHLPLPLMIEFTFIRESLRAFDFINAAQVLCDLMGTKKGHGWIEDDDTCHIVPVFNKQVFYHSKMAGVLIRVIQ